MAEKRKIIELDIDVDAIISKSSQLKTELDKTREAQLALKKAGDTSSDAYVQQAAKINKLSSDYNLNQKQLVNLVSANDKFLTINQKIALALDQENKSITDARQNNAELLKIRNELNLSDEGQIKLAAEINAKLDANNKFIKENVSQYEQQKIGIGDYKTAIVGAIEETGIFGGQIQNVTQFTRNFNGIYSKMKDELSNSISAIKNAGAETEGMGKAQAASAIATNVGSGALRIFKLALAATGIGLLIIGVGLLVAGLSKLDPVMDLIEQATAGIGGAIDKASQIVVKFVSNITSIGDAFNKIGNLIAHPIDSIKSFGKEVGNAAKAAANLKEAEQSLGDLKDIYEIRTKNIESQINLDKIRLKTKDLTAKEEIEIEKRISENFTKINNMRNEVNKNTAEQALELAKQTTIGLTKEEYSRLEQSIKIGDLQVANELLNGERIVNGKIEATSKLGKDAYKKIQEAINAQIDGNNKAAEDEERTQDKIDKARDKAEINAQKIEADAQKRRDTAQKAIDKAIDQSKKEIDLFIAQQGIRAKSLEDSLKIEEQVRDKKLAVNKQEFDAKKITQTEYELQSLNIKNEFLKKQAEITVANAQIELDAQLQTNKSKLEANQFLTDELVAQEIERFNRISEAEAQYQTTRLATGQINAQQYAEAIKAIDDKFAEDKKVLEETKAQEDVDKKAIDLQNKIEADGLAFAFDLELQQERETQRYKQELANADKNGADLTLIKKKYAKNQQDIENQVSQNKLSLMSDTLGNVVTLLGKESKAGKAVAIAQVTIDTFKSAQAAFTGMVSAVPGPVGIALGAVAAGAAVVSGLANVKRITQTEVKLARGAVDIDGPGTSTSDSIPAMLSKGETVIKAEATKNNKGLLRAMNANAGIDFSSQYLPSSVVNMYSSQSNSQGIDYDLLGAKVAEANLNLPKPIVYTAVTDINDGQKDYAQITEGADLWAS